MVEALYKIAPGFRNDRDEVWMIYLSPEERTEMQNKRSLFIDINEKIEDVIKKTARLADCPTDSEIDIEGYVKRRNRLALKYTNEIKILKAKAEEKKKRVQEEELELLTKKPRMTDTCEEDEEVEMEADDYMPTNYMPYTGQAGDGDEEVPARQQASFAEPNLPPPPPEESYTLPESTIFGEADAFLRGVSKQDKQILSDLRPLILKYNCRERVLKVIENLRAIDKRKAAVNIFTAQVANLKSK